MATTSRLGHQDIRIGTIARIGDGADYIRQILPHGFECFQLFAWQHLPPVDMGEYAKQVNDVIGDLAIVSSIGMFGNPLQDEQTVKDWETSIKSCKLLVATLLRGLRGRWRTVPCLTISQSSRKFGRLWSNSPKMRALKSPLRIAIWAAPGIVRVGTSLMRPLRGR